MVEDLVDRIVELVEGVVVCPGDQDHSRLGALALPLQKLMHQGTKSLKL